MELSNQADNYQAMNSYQKPITTPVQPNEPTYNNREIYEASQGNVIRKDDGNLTLTPQGQTNKTHAENSKTAEDDATTLAQKDAQRSLGTDYLAQKSMQSQVEIYLAVANEGKVSSDNTTASILESLRDVQKQNNAVQAYATYQENQSSLGLG